jgi:hypothetical protein
MTREKELRVRKNRVTPGLPDKVHVPEASSARHHIGRTLPEHLVTDPILAQARVVGLRLYRPSDTCEMVSILDRRPVCLLGLTAAALVGPAAGPAATPRAASDHRRAALLLATVAALTVLGVTQGAAGHPGHTH